MDIYVARQPIFDAKRRIYAYELLFRDGAANVFPDIDGDVATSKLLSSTFWTIGIDRLCGGRPVFINFTADLLCRGVPTMFPPASMVVEILEDVEPTPAVIDACRGIVGAGYTLALDDFFFQARAVAPDPAGAHHQDRFSGGSAGRQPSLDRKVGAHGGCIPGREGRNTG